MRRPAFPRSRVVALVCGLLVSLLAATAASAQSGRSTVRGTVRDQQGNVVTGASVTLTDAAKNFARADDQRGGRLHLRRHPARHLPRRGRVVRLQEVDGRRRAGARRYAG